MNKKPTVVTHNAGFHADDVFAVATLKIVLGEIEIKRTRDKDEIEKAEYVVDVGHLHNPKNNRFDHHQTEGGGVRKNGIPYASFGLVWKHFGKELCGSEKIVEAFDKKLAQPIDASDNGFDITRSVFEDIQPYTVGEIVGLFKPTWKEKEKDLDKQFEEAVLWAEKIIRREIQVVSDWVEAEKIVISRYESSDNKELIILNDEDDFGRNLIVDTLSKIDKPLFTVFPRGDHGLWQSVAINEAPDTYNVRKPFPKEWAGLRDLDLAEVTGVSDARFCHRERFMCAALSKEGAIKLAKLALEK